MDTYEVKIKPRRVNLKYRIAGVLCIAALGFLIRFGLGILSATPSETSSGLRTLAVDSGIFSVVLTLVMVFFKSPRVPSYKLLVDEESITGVTEFAGWMPWFVQRTTVRRSRVRTIREIKATTVHSGGLLISERSMFGARMLGGVFLSKDLPEYDDLLQLLEGWQSVECCRQNEVTDCVEPRDRH